MFRAPPLPRTLEAALCDVSASDAATRGSAVVDLVRHADDARSRVVSALERALGDASSEVRAAAAIALSDVRGVEALPSLLVAVEDDDPYVRQMALSAIGEIGDGRARERLSRALSDERPEVRFQAVIAFTRVAPDEADGTIERALADADPKIRYIAVRCAEERAFEGDAQSLDDALRRSLAARLEDDDPAVRVAAAIALARGGDRRGAPILLDVVRGAVTTREPEDEAAAVEMAGDLGLREATPYLERRAFGILGFAEGKFAWQALVSLARLGNVRARGRILGDLSSWSRDRRTMAVAAAGRALLVEARAAVQGMQGDERRADPDAVALTLEQLSSVPSEGEEWAAS